MYRGLGRVVTINEMNTVRKNKKNNQAYSLSLRSTWKQITSPSWISLCANVDLDFINSIIPGLISYNHKKKCKVKIEERKKCTRGKGK